MSSDVRSEPGNAAADPARDDEALRAYEEAKLRYIKGITQGAEAKLREAFAQRREAINQEINDLRALAKTRQEMATAAAERYARKLPHRVKKSGVRPPSLWERLVTFNTVARYYGDAARTAEEVDEVNDLLRKRRDRIDTMERETRRSIYLREEAVRKKLQTPEGLAALHKDPAVKAAFQRMQAVMNERAQWDERVKRGEVTPQEARDHDMAARGIAYAGVPLDGAIIARVVRYGELAYYQLRELSGKEHFLSADPVLEPLRDFVFDVTRSAGGYEASLRHNDQGVPLRVVDHLKATLSQGDAIEAFSKHRAALRNDRVGKRTDPHDEGEAELIAMLGLLAGAVRSRAAAPEPEGEAAG